MRVEPPPAAATAAGSREAEGSGAREAEGSGAREVEGSGARERMLRATLQMIADDGVGAVTNRRVATAAGVSLGSLTYHFSSQTQLLRESLLLYVEEETIRREAIARELGAKGPSVAEAARAVEHLASTNTDPRQIAELELHLHASRDLELRDASERCFQAHEQIAAAALSLLGVEAGPTAPAAVVALMTGLAIRRIAGGGHDTHGMAEALVTLVRGLEERA